MRNYSFLIYFAVVGALFSSCKTFSSGSNVSGLASSSNLDAAANVVANALSPHVKTLVRDTHFYHWAPRARVMSNPGTRSMPSDSETQSYVRSVIDTFWLQASKNDQKMGDGFYLAIDPVVSQSYGDDDWVLIQVIIPAGTRLIAHREIMRKVFSAPEIGQEVGKLGTCRDSHPALILQSLKGCEELTREVLEKLQVFAIVYDFASAQLDGCKRVGDVQENSSLPGLKFLASSGVVVRGKDVIKPGSIVAFTRDDFNGETTSHFTNRLIIEDIFKRSSMRSLWPSLKDKSLPHGLDMTRWIEENLWDCAGTPMLK